ncbi:MAG: AAA family ATPase [Patescibacteria group bacterium]|jgi:wobble nucleotide-excising tRNase
MITQISISKTAIYGDTPVVLDELLQFNYVFGANGSGKTTVSRFLNDTLNPEYSNCSVTYQGISRPNILVYNKDFVDDKLNVSTAIPGIFTFADENEPARAKIKELADTCAGYTKTLEGLNITLNGGDGKPGELGKLQVLDADFRGRCWRQKLKYDADFKSAFSGFRRNSADFMKKVLLEYAENKATLLNIDTLKSKAGSIFTDTQTSEPSFEIIDFSRILTYESSLLLKKVVVGKQDVDIASMIKKLGNSDWVKTGRPYYDINDMYCPFCQQLTTEQFAKELNEYFDLSFESDMKDLQQLYQDYDAESQAIEDKLNTIASRSSVFVDMNQLIAERDTLFALLKANTAIIEQKVKEPSRIFSLQPLNEVVSRISNLLNTANDKIDEHNKLVANIAAERKLLTAQVWRFIIDSELKDEIEKYLDEKNKIEKAITGINARITKTSTELENAQNESSALSRQMTSIEPTVRRINDILRSFGFLSFHLKVAEDRTSYKIVRSNGSDARQTLSEGERAFISFLYFFSMISGSVDADGLAGDRIVVFDDPVSSLDSDVLFIVSSLIKQTIKHSREKISRVRQIFVFTHNVFFHREVTFDINRRGPKRNDETFWVLRKINNRPLAKSHEENPITTSYELLWSQLRDDMSSSSTLANVMRRILEHYFKLLGGMKDEDIFQRFEGDEQLICRSLFSWMNYGSHCSDDDLYVAVDESMVEKYKSVFKKIFVDTGHEKHFEMMMKGFEFPEKEAPLEAPEPVEEAVVG